MRPVRDLLVVLIPVAAALFACGDEADDDVVDEPDEGPRYAEEFTVVELEADAPATLQLAVRACAGLDNRELGGSVYVQQEAQDAAWLAELELVPADTVGATAYLATCTTEFPACVRYSYADQQELLPAILTVAASLGAVPLATELDAACDEPAFDAVVELADHDTPELATRYAFEHHVAETTGLAMLNPGYDLHASDLADPELTRDMPSSMVDVVFARRLFVVFLVNGCEEGHPQRQLLQEIVDVAPWPSPIGVYGYNNSWLIGGYLHEAQTRCLDSRDMGAIPTETGNLSFFSTRRPPIEDTAELEHNPPEDVEYDPARTYVAFVVGDGDNVRFIMTTRNVWLAQRLAACAGADDPCAPLTWSISPHLPHLAPDVLAWYYASSRQTGADYFTLPPSGHLYAYPSSLNEEDQARFVTATEQDARLLGVRGTVHWDWFETWEDAEERFLPRYATADGAIRGVFPINVPYMLDPFPDWPADRFFQVLTGADGGEVVVFRPRQWRGVGGSDDPLTTAFFLSPAEMAAELGSYPPGTVSWVYMTSDGGLTLENSFMELVTLLPPHVQLVGADTAADLALSAHGARM